MPATRDPISTWFDGAARRLLVRAYANREQWVGIFVSPPSPGQRITAATEYGIWNLYERDRWGETRWVRAYKRSVYWHLRYYGRADHIDFTSRRAAAGHKEPFAASLEWETAPGRVMRSGWPTRRWAVRVRLHPAGAAAVAAVEKLPARERWVSTGRASSELDRDWSE